MDRLPLSIRRDLRDTWDNPQSPARQAIAKLSEVLGLTVNVDFEAPMLWAELQKYFPDKDTFVPSVAGVVKSWAECLTIRLDDDSNTEWTDKLLEHINRTGRPQLRAKVETTAGPRPTTSLADRKAPPSSPEFVIALPESSPPYRNPFSAFETDFQAMFDQQAAGNDEGWTNVTTSLPARSSYEPTNQGLAESLPELDSLPRPERLFETTLPYHMIVRIRESNVNSGIVVQSSHQPSLELLAAYLTKYTKSMKGVATKIPGVKVELQESKYGMGILYDAALIINSDSRSVNSYSIDFQNPTLILAFIEGILGYQMIVQNCNETSWHFRRDHRLS